MPERDNWRRATMNDAAQFLNGYPFKPTDWSEQGTPIVRIAQMTGTLDGCDRYRSLVPERFRIKDGDLLFSWSATLMALIWDRGPAFLNQHIFKVVPRECSELGYLHHLLSHQMVRLGEQSHGTTMRHITRADLLPFPVDLPPLPEQRQIAAILDTIDDAIRKTEQIIAKLKQVKQGLLHDLLTRGIDDNGELRDPERHPEQFKDSPLGRIPRVWDVVPLANATDVTVGYVGPTNPYYTAPDRGVLFLRTGNITARGIDCSDARWVTLAFHAAQPKSALRAGDVVVSRVGYTGTAAVVPDLGPVNCANMIIIRCGSALLPDWVRRLFESSVYGRQVSGFTAGSAQPVLNIQLVERLLTPRAPRSEQKHLTSSLGAHEARMEGEEAGLAKLWFLKAGLMEDLLTGRVRVTKLLESAAP